MCPYFSKVTWLVTFDKVPAKMSPASPTSFKGITIATKREMDPPTHFENYNTLAENLPDLHKPTREQLVKFQKK